MNLNQKEKIEHNESESIKKKTQNQHLPIPNSSLNTSI